MECVQALVGYTACDCGAALRPDVHPKYSSSDHVNRSIITIGLAYQPYSPEELMTTAIAERYGCIVTLCAKLVFVIRQSALHVLNPWLSQGSLMTVALIESSCNLSDKLINVSLTPELGPV